LHGNVNALLRDQIGSSMQVRKASRGTLPRWGSRVRIPSSAPRTRTLTSADSAPGEFDGTNVSMSRPSLVHDVRHRVAGHGRLDAPSRSRLLAAPRLPWHRSGDGAVAMAQQDRPWHPPVRSPAARGPGRRGGPRSDPGRPARSLSCSTSGSRPRPRAGPLTP
jgi:hypothetical protein